MVAFDGERHRLVVAAIRAASLDIALSRQALSNGLVVLDLRTASLDVAFDLYPGAACPYIRALNNSFSLLALSASHCLNADTLNGSLKGVSEISHRQSVKYFTLQG